MDEVGYSEDAEVLFSIYTRRGRTRRISLQSIAPLMELLSEGPMQSENSTFHASCRQLKRNLVSCGRIVWQTYNWFNFIVRRKERNLPRRSFLLWSVVMRCEAGKFVARMRWRFVERD